MLGALAVCACPTESPVFQGAQCEETLKMSDKVSAEIDNGTSHNEKRPQNFDEKQPDLSETAGRRASVALNIVENPLKVCAASSNWLSWPTSIDNKHADASFPNSAVVLNRTSPQRQSSRRPMACPNMPPSLVALH